MIATRIREQAMSCYDSGAQKGAIMASSKHFNVKEHTITASHFREYYQATANSQEESLQLCIKQYTAKNNPDPNPGDVTLIGFHASGQVKV